MGSIFFVSKMSPRVSTFNPKCMNHPFFLPQYRTFYENFEQHRIYNPIHNFLPTAQVEANFVVRINIADKLAYLQCLRETHALLYIKFHFSHNRPMIRCLVIINHLSLNDFILTGLGENPIHTVINNHIHWQRIFISVQEVLNT